MTETPSEEKKTKLIQGIYNALAFPTFPLDYLSSHILTPWYTTFLWTLLAGA
jgi:hypothetical protein